jgi:Cys-tRNA(Pro) deacylase
MSTLLKERQGTEVRRSILLRDNHWMPSTPAIHMLRRHEIPFTEHPYRYEEHGGTRVSARELGVPEHSVVKTLVMEDEKRQPLVVLMHGDREVSTKTLARTIGVKTVVPCQPDVAERHTGYPVGGTSPFGTRKALPVFVERTILDLDVVYVNGGRRGFLVAIAPQVFVDVLHATPVGVAITG